MAEADDSEATSSKMKVSRVGLLFVHGIGEQKRFEHLKSAVAEFAEYMVQAEGEAGASASLVDRTDDWKLPPGSPDPNRLAPITLTIRGPKCHTVFDCHEVWWADLGERTGIAAELRFWIWGLGQWCAPIYRELDSAGIAKKKSHDNVVRSKLTKLPGISIAGTRNEPWVRLQLAIASLCTMFVSVTWVLAKRLSAKLLATSPSPTLLVQYVGDVRTYEARAAPGDSALSDPGYPRRVGIRRRMVTEMVAMGSNPELDRWYVVAHSQGTVLAYNGLTEIGHALPNYLSREQWNALPDAFKFDDDCERRPATELPAMMPARPDWLEPCEVVSRPALFEKLEGFLTYGSPLNKFAALWPRIVATATDRKQPQSIVFRPHCRWINLRAYQDPVAGNLASYNEANSPQLKDAIPPLENYDTPYRPNFLIAHILYFLGVERFVHADNPAAKQRRGIGRWLVHGDKQSARVILDNFERSTATALLLVFIPYLVILALLALITTGFVTAVGGVMAALLGSGKATSLASPCTFACDSARTLLPVINASIFVLLLTGYWRWLRESALNLKLAKAAREADRNLDNASYWRRVTALNRAQQWIAALVIVANIAAIVAVKILAINDKAWWSCDPAKAVPGLMEDPWLLLVLVVSSGLAILLQTVVNFRFRPRKEKAGATDPAPELR